jgi:ElaB/YqjD/DUF883 family membrane-anchored ribosome-binding protein
VDEWFEAEEGIMEQTMNRMKEQVSPAQDLYEDGLARGRELAKIASETSAKAFDVSNEWLHENPWMALGVAAGLGVLLGMLMAPSFRNRDHQRQ